MFAVSTDATARHYAMHMRVMLQSLTPGMQQGDEANLGAQVLGSGRDGAQGFGGSVKQNIVNHGLVLVSDDGNLLG